MAESEDMARAIAGGVDGELTGLGNRLLCPEHENLVERPWGGDWLRQFKKIREPRSRGDLPWGESFELAACDDDAEARRFPSRLRIDDGSLIELPDLLREQGDALLGRDFIERYGARFPLLPKFLDIKELLSVQGHPAGHTEVYIIVDAEPGATIRLGFAEDVDAAALADALTRGIENQAALSRLLGDSIEASSLQAIMAPWFADRDADELSVIDRLEKSGARFNEPATARSLLAELKLLYWRMLDAMNAIAVTPGQVIYNATPSRLLDAGQAPSAEVHALGNPEGREILALEIRLPGPTFRAWDNVRFPQREVDVEVAIRSLNLRATRAEEFLCRQEPIAGRYGAFVSVDCEFFRVEHLLPDRSRVVLAPSAGAHSLHCLSGAAEVIGDGKRVLGRLESGHSAFVPRGVGAYSLQAETPAELVRVTLPVN